MTAPVTDAAPTASIGSATRAGSVAGGAGTEAPPDVEILDVTKRFGDVTAVDRMQLRIARGSFYSFLGPSGCGKTTTLRMIAGFEQPTEGEILLAGQPIAGVPPYRRNVNTVFQHYALFPHMDVAQNVGYGLRQRKVGRDEERRRVGEALALVRLSGYERRRTWEMSGGQQQRVALARALVNHPTVLLLDEPLGALDLKLRKEMQLELKALQREVGITFVYVTHDQEEALTMSDVIVVMRDGQVQQQGGPTELYERPVNRFVADFIGTTNFFPASILEVDATGWSTVRSDQGLTMRGRMTDPDRRPTIGENVTVATRPERLEVLPSGMAGEAPAGHVQIPGRILQGTYLGDQTEYRVQTDQAGELIVRHQNASGAGGAPGAGPGDPVIVRWHEEANLVLAG
ncbi:MAG TPA: ABC transporter ATP-binding protein [Candidatus Saccharimonadales bacterium]|nr:ABC transporter ATP-binding protein [Candidatus Saccharimonadales bacterium]